MILIVGLGNPGRKYKGSRHNLGFRVVERVAEQTGGTRWKTQGDALVLRGRHGGRAFLLSKPQTYMNHSGRAVAALLDYYKVPLRDLLVIVDDLDLEPGKIRQRQQGSDGGHRGLRSVIESVGSQSFKRIRIGIGRPPEKQGVVSFVLGRNREQETLLARAVEETAALVTAYLETGEFENWSSS